MAELSAGQVASVVGLVGPPAGTTVAEWVAKARQESSFRDDVENGSHIGLWQINYKLHAGKGTLSVIPEVARGQLKTPFHNFQVAKALYGESGWKPWAASGGKPTPNSADKAAAEDPEAVITGEPDIVDAIGAPFADVTEALQAIVDTVWDGAGWISDRKNWGRIAFVIVGGVVMIGALATIAKPLLPVDQIVPGSGWEPVKGVST